MLTRLYENGLADTGVFGRCGGPPDKDQIPTASSSPATGRSLRVPQRVYEELECDPTADEYPSGNIPYPNGFEEGWITVADEFDYDNPLISTVMDEPSASPSASETFQPHQRNVLRPAADEYLLHKDIDIVLSI